MKKTKAQKKIGKVMKEFKSGKLHSGQSKKIVTNPKQAVAIALSEAGKSKMKKRGGGIANGGMGAALAMGGMPPAGLPSQASANASQALAARPGLPSQAQGARPFATGGQVSGGPKSKQMRMHHKMALGMKFMMGGGQVRGVGAGKMRGTRAAVKGTDFKGVF